MINLPIVSLVGLVVIISVMAYTVYTMLEGSRLESSEKDEEYVENNFVIIDNKNERPRPHSSNPMDIY